MSSLLSYFTSGASAKETTPTKEAPIRALPASWYTSQAMYDFERRAIFSRRWLFITHSSRLKETGDWLRYNTAGFDFIITRDRSGIINAFHNVCRHRAYPIVEKEGYGNAKILACRYHGWSYTLNGKLAKAPGYQELEFEKEENGLFRIHVNVDGNGFVWVNMDAGEIPEVSWEEHFANVDVQARYSHLNFDDYELDHTYELDCQYNWKIASDNFNECYHCPTTHPDIPAFLNLDSFDSDTVDGHIQHHCTSTPEQLAKGLDVHSTYYFPNVSMSTSYVHLPSPTTPSVYTPLTTTKTTPSPHFLMIQKFQPSSPSQTTISYEVYRNKHSSTEDFHLIADMYERVMREDKALCTNAQRNLDRGVFVNGLLHPKYEKAPLFFQKSVREAVTEHFQREKSEGRKVWPARQGGGGVSEEDEGICRGLEYAGGEGKEGLAW
ncbi:ISP domain-containing protein [Clathrospora elynae]|uniref:Choline monooxygenase, chloroplastic n=1 Tax=Clathrospora elynae TaxID=706981 RepID=A0A6A5SDJ3_9PLEO|nr:ISP domain-containing protein [Clathrospora elynae]